VDLEFVGCAVGSGSVLTCVYLLFFSTDVVRIFYPLELARAQKHTTHLPVAIPPGSHPPIDTRDSYNSPPFATISMQSSLLSPIASGYGVAGERAVVDSSSGFFVSNL